MSLDFSKLEKVRVRGNKTTARCPACAESGQDRGGEHLVVNAEGRFACVVYPGDAPAAKTHRKRIFALCGSRNVMELAVRQHVEHPPTALKTGVLGRLGRVFQTHEEPGGEKANNENTFPTGNLNDCEGGVLSVLKAVTPYRPLTEQELYFLRRAGAENDPIIIEALNLFRGRITG